MCEFKLVELRDISKVRNHYPHFTLLQSIYSKYYSVKANGIQEINVFYYFLTENYTRNMQKDINQTVAQFGCLSGVLTTELHTELTLIEGN